MKLLTKVVLIGIIPFFIVGCVSPKVPSIPSSTLASPIPSPSIYQTEMDFSLLYPAGWHYGVDAECCISIASREHIQPMQYSYQDGEIVMEVINVLDTPTSGFGDPFLAMQAHADVLGIKMPDQEAVHNVNLNGKDFLIGTYSEDYIETAWLGYRAPIFVGVYNTDQNTIIVSLYAARNDEEQLRRVFEELLLSIEDNP